MVFRISGNDVFLPLFLVLFSHYLFKCAFADLAGKYLAGNEVADKIRRAMTFHFTHKHTSDLS